MKILLTGVAGFIGSHTARALLEHGNTVIGIDDFNDYYDVSLKEGRVAEFLKHPLFKLYRDDITNEEAMSKIFAENDIDKVCHLAARAGVRYAIKYPLLYERVNVGGTTLLLELAKQHDIQNFVYASSSSVYGGNTKVPFSENDRVDHPISPYAATKKACELMAHTYSHLHGLKTTGLRFFTVYGPAGRPDMALFIFTKKILAGEPIDVYNYGKMKRDFTYIDDIAKGVLAALDADFDYEIFNLGNSNTVELNYFIQLIEQGLGCEAIRNEMPIQPGDVPVTYADISHARDKLGFDPKISIEEGIDRFLSWYKTYYKIA